LGMFFTKIIVKGGIWFQATRGGYTLLCFIPILLKGFLEYPFPLPLFLCACSLSS
jgi:hypothetical protein